jgi:hypothetical protein
LGRPDFSHGSIPAGALIPAPIAVAAALRRESGSGVLRFDWYRSCQRHPLPVIWMTRRFRLPLRHAGDHPDKRRSASNGETLGRVSGSAASSEGVGDALQSPLRTGRRPGS